MMYYGNLLREQYYKTTQEEMHTQLSLSVERIEQYLETLKRDMLFISKLDVMNDIYSDDVDRRISTLLENKKKELTLDGDFHLVAKDGKILSSSNVEKLFQKFTDTSFMRVKVYSPIDNAPIADLVLEFSLQNITHFFENSTQRQYYMILNKTKELYKVDSFENHINVSKNLKSKQEIEIVLEQNQDIFLNLLKTYEYWFILMLIVGAVIIGFIALFFINILIRPIIELSSVVEDIIENKDYSHQVKVHSQDEIGKLSSSFNTMLIGIYNALEELKKEAKNRENLIEEKGKNEMLQELSRKLSKYLSPQVYESIFSGAQDVTLTSKRKKLTIFFSDIVNFTDTTDTMESEDLSELLNDYLNNMTLIALEYGATVDKYIGDAIMLFFGDPHSKGISEDAKACVHMALAMHDKMDDLQRKWKSKGFTKPFQVRMGIHTGYCTVGNFGSQDRLEYTIIGSSVNLASRIESSAKPDDILISEETMLLVSDTFRCTEVKTLTPKGFKRAIALYKVENNDSVDVEEFEITNKGFLLSCNLNNLSQEDKHSLKNQLSEILQKI